MMIENRIIDEVTKRLVGTYNPVEIYLFGSYAWGHPSEDSDLDILVVVDELSQKPWEELATGHRALSNLGIAKDLLLIDKTRFEQYAQEPRRLYYKIKKEGKKVYVRA